MAREKFPSDEIDRIMVRFPAGMRDRIAQAAQANGRSMNSEIVARLQRSLSGPTIDDPLLTESDLALMKEIHARSQRTLYDISAQAERITSAVETLLSKAMVMPDGRPASELPPDMKGE